MSRRRWWGTAGCLGAALVLAGHDLFLRPQAFLLPPGREVAVVVVNGTFTRSDAAVAPARVRALELVGPHGRQALPIARWRAEGDSARLRFRLPQAGTYVLGVALYPRTLELSAAAFDRYLREEGLDDIRRDRQRQGRTEQSARERYTKHAKALLQAGSTRTDAPLRRLGHTAELVPLDHPYRLRAGETLRLQAWVRGAPAPGVTVIAAGLDRRGRRLPVQRLRTDAQGTVRLRLTAPGVWYAKFIAMRALPPDSSVDYVSDWATLTFAVPR